MRTLPLYLLGFAIPALASLQANPVPSFHNASVHDPSIIEADGAYYVFGSHLASAWSPDLMNWYQVTSSVGNGNRLFPNVLTDLAPVFEWSSTETLWAPDVHLMDDGSYAFFYCASQEDAPRASLGLAKSDAILGPYQNQGILLQSGMWNEISPAGSIYDATIHPNAVDPALFNDPSGRLYMVYGSYSGGIFVIELDPSAGTVMAGQGYGTKIMGGNHARIEGAYVAYNKDTGYYYVFVSFGGLAADGGYNIRVARSRSPKGPYLDPAGQDMINAKGASGTLFDDVSIAPYGAKLMGNCQFLHASGEHYTTSNGYVSPGHNSILHDSVNGKWFNVFHTRFVGQGESHEVRVHQVFFNADGWPVVAPQRYAGESIGSYDVTNLAGTYKVINHGKDITATVKTSTNWEFNADGSITGIGTWTLDNGHDTVLSLGGIQYKGVFCRMWDDDNRLWVNTFTALSSSGVALWGSELGIPERTQPYTAPDFATVPAQTLRPGETLLVALEDQQQTTPYLYEYRLLEAPDGATLDTLTGRVSYTPLLGDSGQDKTIRVEAFDAIETSITAEVGFSVHVGNPFTYVSRSNTFTSIGGTGLKDTNGNQTGLTARLNGSSNPSNDTLLTLDTANGVLNMRTSKSDFNGQAGVSLMTAPGRLLSEFGFTGSEDFAVTATFGPVSNLGTADQVGLYVGASVTKLTRAGVIALDTTQAYSVDTSGTTDSGGHFASTVDLSSGLTVVISRNKGIWQYSVNGVATHPLNGEAEFLNSLNDLTVGVFAITPLNSNQKTAPLKSLTVSVTSSDSDSTALAQWLETHSGQNSSIGDDPDNDGMSNLMEYALDCDPLQSDAWVHIKSQYHAGRLDLEFTRRADPSLRYLLESATSANASTWSKVWSSEGTDNAAGTVKVSRSFGSPVQLRFRVETSDSAVDPGTKSSRNLVDAGLVTWMETNAQSTIVNDSLWTQGFGWSYIGCWPWVYLWDGTGWACINGADAGDSWVYLPDPNEWYWSATDFWPWAWNNSKGWLKLHGSK